jgi:hypothetical protein
MLKGDICWHKTADEMGISFGTKQGQDEYLLRVMFIGMKQGMRWVSVEGTTLVK